MEHMKGPEPPRQRVGTQEGSQGGDDIFRQSLLRYVAFTSDVGEAFKPFISRRLYLGSCAVVALYGLADTLDKGWRAHERAAAARKPTPGLAVPPLAGAAAAAASAAVPAAPAQTPPMPLASLTAAVRSRSSSGAAAACAACLPPAAAYHATSISEQRAAAVPVAAAVLDAALWHSAASLAIPAVAINRTVWATGKLLSRGAWAAALHPRLRQLVPSAAGLALIPLLVPHIDEAVTGWMDQHLRPRLPQQEATAASPNDAHREALPQ
ncbi:hypothetical protein CHLNCDRAFT_144543 [Chlorella variabilis]|uniref:Mitochondrial fission process protein 1 n=1 Tax=Chlorella variabilis TaxID=554065 RepID=E1ZBN1_CHLVA|nr:hypothetical protein CHLNCDRAFT_144543 [Chlorella variabilis]EFN56674.1 hypothetical protein CHLNCDRAFT_144543 [Chlorella variabilis]|eukprot:XP_005848776.1 hypothetical protein CHLNCDRAFT_144543 [Chlorella variabilis]